MATETERATYDLMAMIGKRGTPISYADAYTLRRAAMTLHRWAELECGDGDDHKSWAIERSEESGRPLMGYHWHDGTTQYDPIPDRETGALRRVKALCDRLGLHFYHQADPRGAALYVSTEPLTQSDYTRGIAVV